MKKRNVLFILAGVLLVGCATNNEPTNDNHQKEEEAIKDVIVSKNERHQLLAKDATSVLISLPNQSLKASLKLKNDKDDALDSEDLDHDDIDSEIDSEIDSKEDKKDHDDKDDHDDDKDHDDNGKGHKFDEELNVTAEEVSTILAQANVLANAEDKLLVTEETSDKEEYLNKNVVSFTDVTNTTYTYALYFNDVITNTEVEEGEEETEVKYQGIAVVDEMTYNFKFESETEIEENETETSLKFMLFMDETSYISIENSFETEENEMEASYRYTVVENGVKTSSYKLNQETENGKTHMVLTFNGVKYIIKEKEVEGKVLVYVKVKGQKEEFVYEKVEVTNEDGSVTVSYVVYEKPAEVLPDQPTSETPVLPSEPVVSEPVVSEPVASEPVVSEPVVSEVISEEVLEPVASEVATESQVEVVA